jgi:metal-dependent hydrolase (beta-lactamase superfamily II)
MVSGEKQGNLLFDTGVRKKGILWNMDALKIDLADIQAIIPIRIAALKEINSRYVMPGHCTGW